MGRRNGPQTGVPDLRSGPGQVPDVGDLPLEFLHFGEIICGADEPQLVGQALSPATGRSGTRGPAPPSCDNSCLLLTFLFLAGALHAAQPWSVEDLWSWREVTEARIRPDGAMAVWVESAANRDRDSFCTTIWFASAPGSEPRQLDGKGCHESLPRWSPDGHRVAYISDRPGVIDAPGGVPQIWVRGFVDARPHQLSRIASRPTTLAWSPDGTALAYTAYLPSESGETRSPRTALFVVPISGVAPVRAPTGKLDLFGEPAWMPDGRTILISAAEPGGDTEIYAIGLDGAGARRISNHPGRDFSLLPSPDGSRIAWISRDAKPGQSYVTAKLYVANADGSRAKVLAGALDRDPTHIQWSSDSRTVYFLADDRGATHVWSARADGSVRQVTIARERLTDFSLADNGRAVAVRAAVEIVTFPADVRGAGAILAAPNAGLLAARATSAAEEIEFPSAGRTIQAWIVKPPAFELGRRYPLIVDVQDSPRRMCGIEFSLRTQIFAAHGFVVLCANPRGTPGFGEEFGNLLRTRDPGDDFDDLMAGVDYLARQGFVDPARVHVIGGLLAAWAIGQTDRFRSAVAVDPVVVYGAAPDRSPIFYADQFHTPTLVIDRGAGTGAIDLYSALRARRIETALVHDPGEQTPTRQDAQMQAILDWFQR